MWVNSLKEKTLFPIYWILELISNNTVKVPGDLLPEL